MNSFLVRGGLAFASAAAFLVWSLPAPAAPPAVRWQRELNVDTNQSGNVIADLAVDRSGNVLITGGQDSIERVTTATDLKYDPEGTLTWWAVTFGGRGANGVAVAVRRSGDAFFLANSDALDGLLRPIFILWSAAGDVLYAPYLDLPGQTSVEGVGTILDSGENPIVAFNHTQELSHGVVKKFPANGPADAAPLWQTVLAAPTGVSVRLAVMTLDANGNIIVAGQATLPDPTAGPVAGPPSTAYVVASLAPDGTQNWLRIHMPPASPENRATAVTTDMAGSVYVTGVAQSAHDPTHTAALTVKFLSDGTEAWAKAFDATERGNPSLGAQLQGTCIAVDSYVWVGCRPFALARLSVQNGDLSAYSYYPVDSGVEATLDRIITLEPGRGLLVAGSFADENDDIPGGSVLVQHFDHSLNRGWSQRVSPPGASQSEVADFVRGKNDFLFLGINNQLTASPGMGATLVAIAPPAVPVVTVRAVVPFAFEPVREGGFAINGRFRIYLSKPAEQDLTVHFHLAGSAEWDMDNGADYLLPATAGPVVINAGARFADVVIRPLADDLREPIETVRLELVPTSLPTLNDYKLGVPSKATVYVFDRTPRRPRPIFKPPLSRGK